MELAGKHVVVVGLGKSGIAAARLLLSRGASVSANDRRGRDELPEEALALEHAGAGLALGGHDAAVLSRADLIVVSPGVPPQPALEAAQQAGVPIWSEIELASRFLEATLLGVTGTNGKSTVTSLVGAMCALTERPTFVGGNLGTPLIEAVGTRAAERGGFVVVELSSFQLERIDTLHVHAGALLNVSPDHLDRYPSFDAYARAKAGLFVNQEPQDTAVVPAGDARCLALAETGRGRIRRFGGDDGEVRLIDGELRDEHSGLRVAVEEIALTGRHNLENACAAALLARSVGVDSDAIARALCAFRGLPHRMQEVAEVGGVRYIDDSKGTNVGATAAALDGLALGAGKVVLIAGGKDKGGEYEPVIARMVKAGRGLVLIGEAAALIEAAADRRGVPTQRAASMDDAVVRAAATAEPGDVVLLSPACASFDMFRSYAHRGEAFQGAVQRLAPSQTEADA